MIAVLIAAALLLLHFSGQEGVTLTGRREYAQLSSGTELVSRPPGETAQSTAVLPADVDTSAGGASISYSDRITVHASQNNASLLFDNPAGSGSDMVLTMYIAGRKVGTSDLLHPGNSVREMGIDARNLEYGLQDGTLVVDHFEPETGRQSYFSLSIDTVVEITD